MVQLAVGALLAASAAMFFAARPGARWLARRFTNGTNRRGFIIGAASLVAIANFICLFQPELRIERDIVTGATLIAFAVITVDLWRAQFASGTLTEPPLTSIVAVGAHPDDLELACGGSLAKLADAGYAVHAIVMSHGQVGGDRSLRPTEARAGGNFLGLASVSVLDFPDTELSSHNAEMIAAIEKLILETHPSLVLTHSEHDHHQDHLAVHLATLRAARRHSSILCFESPSATRKFDPSVYVDIGTYVEVKVRAVQMHRNQSGKPYMSAERIRGIAAFRGSQAKREFAEGFEPVRLLAKAPGVAL